MYPLTSPYYTQQFGVSILYQIVQYIHRHTHTTLQLFTPHLLHSVTFRHSWGGGRNCIGQPQKYQTTTWTAKFFCVSVPKHGIDEGRHRQQRVSFRRDQQQALALTELAAHGGSVLYDQSHSNEDIRQLRPNHHHTHLVVWPTTTLSSSSKDSLLRCQRRAKL